MYGTLYGIGVGPGNPELLTLKAVRILGEVSRVFAAASSKNDYSLAFDIVREHLKPGTPVDQLPFPMTFDRSHMEEAWRENSEAVAAHLREGRDAAFLTIGDPLTFSTYIYLVRNVREILPGVRVETVPGITSFQAAAACANVPLAEGEEALTIVSGAKGGEKLREVLAASENVILMKTYRQFPDIVSAIREMGLQDSCCFVSRCGLPGEIVERDFEKYSKLDPHYLSLMIIKKRGTGA